MVAFPHPVRLEGERTDKKTVWFKVDRNEHAEDTRDQAWEWFGEVSRRYAQQVMGPEATGQSPGYGPYDTKKEKMGSTTMGQRPNRGCFEWCLNQPWAMAVSE